MKRNIMQRISNIGYATLLAASRASAEDHQWAGRALDDFEWTVLERLVAIPFHGVFDTLNFEVQGKTVTLSGQIMNDRVKQAAERVVSLYRAISEKEPLEKYGRRAAPSIQIIAKDGWVALEGLVDSDANRGMVRLRALKVTAHVADNLRIAPEL